MKTKLLKKVRKRYTIQHWSYLELVEMDYPAEAEFLIDLLNPDWLKGGIYEVVDNTPNWVRDYTLIGRFLTREQAITAVQEAIRKDYGK